MYREIKESVFSIGSHNGFNAAALKVFKFQYRYNDVYHTFCNTIGRTPETVTETEEIPFLPISFFKSKDVVSSHSLMKEQGEPVTFLSSSTTSATPSRHIVHDVSLYRQSFRSTFNRFYGNTSNYCILALLPSYLRRSSSSLVFMAEDMVQQSLNPNSGFYLYNLGELSMKLDLLEKQGQKTLLLGVTYALLDFAEKYPVALKHCIVMETGGMKGERKELPREGVHKILKNAFSLNSIHSEYGMTELLSQAYSDGNGLFHPPPWMRVLARDRYDPFKSGLLNQTGGINIIDLANINSCSFIATDDAGIAHPDGSFEITGRLEASDIRGCNLMFNE